MCRRLVGSVALTLVLLAFSRTERTRADTPLDAGAINAGLRTPTTADQGFVNNVVALANKGKLPASLVQTTFLSAGKRSLSSFRFQYFQAGADRAGQKSGDHRNRCEIKLIDILGDFPSA